MWAQNVLKRMPFKRITITVVPKIHLSGTSTITGYKMKGLSVRCHSPDRATTLLAQGDAARSFPPLAICHCFPLLSPSPYLSSSSFPRVRVHVTLHSIYHRTALKRAELLVQLKQTVLQS